jgi:hypothetical protein
MNNWFVCWFFTYIKEMHGSKSKIPSKKSRHQRCTEGFNSGAKGLIKTLGNVSLYSHSLFFFSASFFYFSSW